MKFSFDILLKMCHFILFNLEDKNRKNVGV